MSQQPWPSATCRWLLTNSTGFSGRLFQSARSVAILPRHTPKILTAAANSVSGGFALISQFTHNAMQGA